MPKDNKIGLAGTKCDTMEKKFYIMAEILMGRLQWII